MYSVTVTVQLFSELDALGDELLLDDDSSYLDEASTAPSIPEGIPSDSKTNKVTVFRALCSTDFTVTDIIIEAQNRSQTSIFINVK